MQLVHDYVAQNLFPVFKKRHVILIENLQVAGWVQEYKGLTFATFRGAGHAVPLFKPSESLAFFAAFINDESPP